MTNMTTITLNSSYLNFVNVSTYNGVFDVNCMYDWELSQMPDFIEYNNTDYKAMGEAIVTYYMQAMHEDFLSELPYIGGYDLESSKFYMPKAYNFDDDSFSIDLQVNYLELIDRLNELLTDNKEDCEEFLSENWRTRSGFISFMPEYIDELENCEDLEKILAFVLNMEYKLNFEGSEIHFDAYEKMSGNTSMYDFVSFKLNEDVDMELMKDFTLHSDEEIEEYIISNKIATKKEIYGLVGYTYALHVLEFLRIDKADFDWDMELPIDSKRTAMFVILWLNEITEIK